MTGRGRGFYMHRSSNPLVTIGISLDTSSPALDPSSPSPFFVIVTAHVLSTPQPSSPITLATHYNPLGNLHMRSFNNIECVSPPASAQEGKHIEIWPRGWPNFNTGERDLREKYNFVTVPPKESPAVEEGQRSLEIRHEVPRDRIVAAQLEKGERYRVRLTDKGLGTYWWMLGTLQDVEGMKFRAWMPKEQEEREKKEETPEEEWDEEERESRTGPWFMGEEADKLALIVEKGEVEFEII